MGHATIALGSVLASVHGEGNYTLTLNDTTISVEGKKENGVFKAALQSPETHYELISDAEVNSTLALFNYEINTGQRPYSSGSYSWWRRSLRYCFEIRFRFVFDDLYPR